MAAVAAAAQAADSLTSSSGLLLFLLGGGLIGAVVSVYRFFVNYRTTERSMSRQRVQQATSSAREAQHEAFLWQARCADLEWLLRRNGHAALIPPLSLELQALVTPAAPDTDAVDWNITGPSNTDNTGRSPG